MYHDRPQKRIKRYVVAGEDDWNEETALHRYSSNPAPTSELDHVPRGLRNPVGMRMLSFKRPIFYWQKTLRKPTRGMYHAWLCYKL